MLCFTIMEAQEVFKKSEVKVWECRNCGHIVSRRESTGSLSGMRASAGLFRGSCGELLNFGNDETPAEGAADSLLCIKRKMHHIKDTKIKQAVLDPFI